MMYLSVIALHIHALWQAVTQCQRLSPLDTALHIHLWVNQEALPPAGQGMAQSDVKVGYWGASHLCFILWQANLGMRSWQRQPLARESRHAFVYLRPLLCLAL